MVMFVIDIFTASTRLEGAYFYHGERNIAGIAIYDSDAGLEFALNTAQLYI